MRRLSRFIAVSLAAVGLGACGGGRPIRYYTVELPPTPQPSTKVYPITILIGRIGAPEILQDEPIAYRTGPNEIGTYGYHHWVEPPVRMVKVMLFRELRASGKYQSVAELGSSAQGEFVLQGRLYDFEEVDAGSIAALVTMEFELVERKTGQAVWTHFYTHTEPVPGKEIPDVVSALDRNLERGVGEVASGLDAYFSTHLPGKS
ncbi:MAG TPA: ABC-type transport auxiliary lipoprotein family protein [Terriglobia bacterium]|nr:ABC-type transport auxiliary lipoprotein family protein [Terriglobia bacterium]